MEYRISNRIHNKIRKIYYCLNRICESKTIVHVLYEIQE